MYQFRSRVRYSEVNSEKHLTLPSLLDYLQDCCTFQSEDLGIGVDYLERASAAWVLSSWEIEILRYPKMGESIAVSTWPYYFKGFFGHRNFLVESEAHEVLAKANSVWVFMDTARMRPCKVSDEVAEVYSREFAEPLAGNWGERKILIPQQRVEKEPVHVARFHIDTNHHVNNGKYVLAAEEYLPDGFEVAKLRVEYKKAAVLGDVLYPSVTVGRDTATVILADEQDNPYAVVEFGRSGRAEGE